MQVGSLGATFVCSLKQRKTGLRLYRVNLSNVYKAHIKPLPRLGLKTSLRHEKFSRLLCFSCEIELVHVKLMHDTREILAFQLDPKYFTLNQVLHIELCACSKYKGLISLLIT